MSVCSSVLLSYSHSGQPSLLLVPGAPSVQKHPVFPAPLAEYPIPDTSVGPFVAAPFTQPLAHL